MYLLMLFLALFVIGLGYFSSVLLELFIGPLSRKRMVLHLAGWAAFYWALRRVDAALSWHSHLEHIAFFALFMLVWWGISKGWVKDVHKV